MDFMWIIWLSIFVVALVIEAIGTDLVSIWFAAGALVALILSLIPDVPWWVELIIFVVISLATLCCFRPLVHKYMRRNLVNSNIDEMVHKKGLLVAKIDLLHHGEVKINDVIWTAIADEEKVSIPVGATVEVLAVSGNKLIVREVKETTTEGGH
jgi:membrane protein implicated in regulation of membrane protease activity